MTSESSGAEGDNPGSPGVEELARFGITRVPVEYFHFRQYRYSRLEDALAAAGRAQTNAQVQPATDERIGAHFALENMRKGARGQSAAGAGARMDQPWCDSKGRNIVEVGYTK